MSSICSSPRSQHSPRSSIGPLSPETAVTTPRSCTASPKLNSACNLPSPPLSPRGAQTYASLGSPSPSYPASAYSVAEAPLSPSYGDNQYPLSMDPEPSSYDEAVNFYLYSPFSPVNLYYEPPVEPVYPYEEYSPWTGYSGYPPASAFYGPLPGEPSSSFVQSCSSYGVIDPREYQLEEWQTADGRKVEYSAMHLHCATM
jgi:hypothetical protein